MNRVKMTEHLNVFDSGLFVPFGYDGEERRLMRRLYVGFVRDAEDDSKRWPVVTALFTVMRKFPDDANDSNYYLDWLETSRYIGDMEPDLDGQVIRDEFMAALKELHPECEVDMETQKDEDGSVYYLDTLDAEEAAV